MSDAVLKTAEWRMLRGGGAALLNDEECVAVREELARLRAEVARLVEDRARFPDKPDDIGRMIDAHIGNLRESASRHESAWRAECINTQALRAELSQRDATIAELRGALDAYRGQVDRYGRHSAADALAAAPQPAQEAAQPVADKWDGAEEWMPLAWQLCADECGEEACNELVWEGGPIPEPWGERWLKYEDEAKRLIALVRKHVPQPQPAADQAARDAVDAGRWRLLESNEVIAAGDEFLDDDATTWVAMEKGTPHSLPIGCPYTPMFKPMRRKVAIAADAAKGADQ